MMRRPNTKKEMEMSGEWNLIGRRHYRHISGVEITYDNMTFGYRASDVPAESYRFLWVVKYDVEKRNPFSGVTE